MTICPQVLGLRFVLMVWFSRVRALETSDTECFPNGGGGKMSRVTENIHRWSSASLLHSKEVQKGNQRWMEKGTSFIAGSRYGEESVIWELFLRQQLAVA